MANSETAYAKLQSSIKVDVGYYDEVEKAKLLRYSSANEIAVAVQDGVTIPTEEFLTYYLFHKKRLGKKGWEGYKEIGEKIERAHAELDEWIDFDGNSISTPKNVGRQDKTITERIGESIGMSVISSIHQLTDADWIHVPEHAGKTGFPTFDYEISSDAKEIVQLEAKGSSLKRNAARASTIINHRNNILGKKKVIAASEKENTYKYKANTRYGTITVLGEESNVPVKCLLVDPPSTASRESARRLRILLRMRFLSRWISFMAPKSQLAAALNTRTAALGAMVDPFELDKLPLRKGDGRTFNYSSRSSSGHTTFFQGKAQIIDRKVGGIVVPCGGNLFFLGFHEDWLQMAATQNFKSLLEYSAVPTSENNSVDVQLTDSKVQELEVPTDLLSRDETNGSDGHVRFTLKGEIHYARSGLAFGGLLFPKRHQESRVETEETLRSSSKNKILR